MVKNTCHIFNSVWDILEISIHRKSIFRMKLFNQQQNYAWKKSDIFTIFLQLEITGFFHMKYLFAKSQPLYEIRITDLSEVYCLVKE